MIALNFKEEFADLVARGRKKQTIRRTNRFKVGDTIQLYTGQRTKVCRKLGEAVVWNVARVIIDEFSFSFHQKHFNDFRGDYVEWRVFAHETTLDMQAKKDGFKDFEAMKAFFVAQYGDLPFEGYLIQWKLKGGEG